eukprot:827827-Pyramimonas_sp.AAC.1
MPTIRAYLYRRLVLVGVVEAANAQRKHLSEDRRSASAPKLVAYLSRFGPGQQGRGVYLLAVIYPRWRQASPHRSASASTGDKPTQQVLSPPPLVTNIQLVCRRRLQINSSVADMRILVEKDYPRAKSSTH